VVSTEVGGTVGIREIYIPLSEIESRTLQAVAYSLSQFVKIRFSLRNPTI